MPPLARPAVAPRWPLPAPLLYAVLFSLIWVLHAPLLRLPYFWDEAGYFVPAARDLLLTGDPIPVSTLSNAHPPLVMAWLAFWWKFSAYTPAVTRTAMLLVSAFALLGVFRLARKVSNTAVAAASTLLTALYPVFFAQSSLAHLDMAAAAFTLWGLGSYLPPRPENRWRAVAWFACAGLAKETAIVTPLALFLWEWVGPLVRRRTSDQPSEDAGAGGFLRSLSLLVSLLPLAAWLAYHRARTGMVFGNPEYFRYNVAGVLNPLRILLALAQRCWQLLAYLNMFVLTGAAALAMDYPPLSAPAPQADPVSPVVRSAGETRGRIAISVQLAFAVVMVAYVVMLALVGGAVLARYLLPVYPLVIILCVATLWRRLSWWPVAVGVTALAFLAGLFVAPLYRIAPEDNLAYADYVHLHQQAEQKLALLPGARVLTAWPATDELAKPYLGYVSHAVPVVAIEDFTLARLLHATLRRGQYNYALVFSTKYEPAFPLLGGWWERLQTRFFGYHRDLGSRTAAEVLGGRVIYEQHRGAQWVAIIAAGGAGEQHDVWNLPRPSIP